MYEKDGKKKGFRNFLSSNDINIYRKADSQHYKNSIQKNNNLEENIKEEEEKKKKTI